MLVNVTVPVFNEEVRLKSHVPNLCRFLTEHCPFQFEVVIVDNASTDRSLQIAHELSRQHDTLRVVHLDQKGRGRAIKRIWSDSSASILSYMDVDLSTDLFSLQPLIEALIQGEYDVAVGSRLLKQSITIRGWKREVISRCYNRIIKIMFHTGFSDAQCGFKAVTKMVAMRLLPLVKDDGWFMDTELLILAEKMGYRIFDLPVRWVEDSDSRVKIWSTALEDIKGLIRVRRDLRERHLYSRQGDIFRSG